LEKGYCSFGHDIGPDDTPLQAGLGFTTKLADNIDFVGREALQCQKADGVDRRKIVVCVDDPEVMLMGLEPIVVDGDIRGYLTSAGYGHSVGCSVGVGYVRLNDLPVKQLVETAKFEVEVALERFSARASVRALYDPDGARLRS